MAYTAVPTAYDDAPGWGAAWINRYIGANFAAGVPDIFTTKGDLAVATAADTATRFAVGADGLVLTADSTVTATGLRWAHPGLVKVNDAGTQGAVGSLEKLTELDNEYYDLYGAWASDRFTCNFPGYYLVTCMFQFGSYPSGNLDVGDGCQFMIYKNGAIYSVISMEFVQAAADNIISTSGADVVYLAPGDYIEFYALPITSILTINRNAEDVSHHISISILPS